MANTGRGGAQHLGIADIRVIVDSHLSLVAEQKGEMPELCAA